MSAVSSSGGTLAYRTSSTCNGSVHQVLVSITVMLVVFSSDKALACGASSTSNWSVHQVLVSVSVRSAVSDSDETLAHGATSPCSRSVHKGLVGQQSQTVTRLWQQGSGKELAGACAGSFAEILVQGFAPVSYTHLTLPTNIAV